MTKPIQVGVNIAVETTDGEEATFLKRRVDLIILPHRKGCEVIVLEAGRPSPGEVKTGDVLKPGDKMEINYRLSWDHKRGSSSDND